MRPLSDNILPAQREVCRRFGVEPLPSPSDLRVGIAENVEQESWPINGLRHEPEGDTTGWYIWAGEELSDDPDFFRPLHVEHLAERCQAVLPYLALPPGWRFLIAAGYEDVWEDTTLVTPDPSS
jgi:hypothetical protein